MGLGVAAPASRSSLPALAPLVAFVRRRAAGRRAGRSRCGSSAAACSSAAALAQLGVGALLIGLDSYVPTFAQGVLGHRAARRRASRWPR